MTKLRRTLRPALLIAAISAASVVLIDSTPAPAQTTRPALTQLSQDIQSLYRDAEAGTVRVRVPMPMLAENDPAHPLLKWDQHLNADVRERLRESRMEGPVRIRVDRAQTAPSTQPATNQAATATQPAAVTSDARAIDADHGLRFDLLAPDFPTNEHVGLVLDDQGHVLVHCYVDRRTLRDRPIRASAGGKTVDAQVVGSDRQTRLTVLKMSEPIGKPLQLSGAEPQPGALVMMLAGGRQAGLLLWTGRNLEHGLVINTDGAVAGFSHGGQLVSGAAFKPIVEQLIADGEVKRAKLGAMIDTVATDDPLRNRIPTLGHRPAIRVARVVPNSAAQKAGLRDNDIILSLAGEPVTDIFAFAATIAHCRGDTELKVLRGDEELTITAKLQPE